MALLVDLLALALVAALAWLGWRRGFVITGLALLGPVLGYPCAYLLHRPAGDVVARLFGLQPLIAYPLGGMLVFAIVVALALVARAQVARRRREREARPSTAGRVAGAAVGGLYALALVVLVVGALQLLSALRPALDLGGGLAGHVALPIWQGVARAAVRGTSRNDALAATASRFVARPAETTRGLEAVFGDPRLQELLRDPEAAAELGRADRTSVQLNPSLQALIRDPAFVQAARSAGFIEDAGGAGGDAAVTLAHGLAPVATAVHALGRDQEVLRLLEDPDLRAALEARDVGRLANDPKFNQVASLVVAHLRGDQPPGSVAPAAAIPGRAPPSSEPGSARPPSGPPIYKWVDPRGVVHFSDDPPVGRRYETIRPR